jgi:hypothetical protein
VQRFEREAQAAGRIGSEHIVEVLDLGNLPTGDRFMVMEYMDGDSLSARIQKRGRLTARETYPIARQILEGLSAAHGAGIIHRDLKPDNAFLLKTRGGQVDFVKLLDFGISKFSALSGESGFSMTRTGAVMGTPYYMSPEQAKGAKGMDHRADLYAVGVILYECITGRVPFNADTFNELLFKIVLETPQPIEEVVPDSDSAFNLLIQKAMAREPSARFKTAKEFKEAVEAWAAGAGFQGAVAASFGQTPLPRAPAGSLPGTTPAQPLRTGTPGTWASTGSGPLPYIEGATQKAPNRTVIAAIAAGVVALGAVGFFVMHGSSAAPVASAVPATPPPAGPSMDDVRAAAAQEAQRVALLAQKDADEKIKKAEDEAKAAEARATAAEANSKDQDDAAKARERVKVLKAAVAANGAKPVAAPAKPADSPPPAANNAPAPASTGRHIRTEL